MCCLHTGLLLAVKAPLDRPDALHYCLYLNMTHCFSSSNSVESSFVEANPIIKLVWVADGLDYFKAICHTAYN